MSCLLNISLLKHNNYQVEVINNETRKASKKEMGNSSHEEEKLPPFTFFRRSLASVRGVFEAKEFQNLIEEKNGIYIFPSLTLFLLGLGKVFESELQGQEGEKILSDLINESMEEFSEDQVLKDVLPFLANSPILDLFIDNLTKKIGSDEYFEKRIPTFGNTYLNAKAFSQQVNALSLEPEAKLALQAKTLNYCFTFQSYETRYIEKKFQHEGNPQYAYNSIYESFRTAFGPKQVVDFLIKATPSCEKPSPSIAFNWGLQSEEHSKETSLADDFYLPFWKCFLAYNKEIDRKEILTLTTPFLFENSWISYSFVLALIFEKENWSWDDLESMTHLFQIDCKCDQPEVLSFFATSFFKHNPSLEKEIIPFLNRQTTKDLEDPQRRLFFEMLVLCLPETYEKANKLNKEVIEKIALPVLQKLQTDYRGWFDYTCLFSHMIYCQAKTPLELLEIVKGRTETTLAYLNDLFAAFPDKGGLVLDEVCKNVKLDDATFLRWYRTYVDRLKMDSKIFVQLFYTFNFTTDYFDNILKIFSPSFSMRLGKNISIKYFDYLKKIETSYFLKFFALGNLMSLLMRPDLASTTTDFLNQFGPQLLTSIPGVLIQNLPSSYLKSFAEKFPQNFSLENSKVKDWDEKNVEACIHFFVSVWIYNSESKTKEKVFEWIDRLLEIKSLPLEKGLACIETYPLCYENDQKQYFHFFTALHKKKGTVVSTYFETKGRGLALQTYFQGYKGRIDNPLFLEKIEECQTYIATQLLKKLEEDPDNILSDKEILNFVRWMEGFSLQQFKHIGKVFPYELSQFLYNMWLKKLDTNSSRNKYDTYLFKERSYKLTTGKLDKILWTMFFSQFESSENLLNSKSDFLGDTPLEAVSRFFKEATTIYEGNFYEKTHPNLLKFLANYIPSKDEETLLKNLKQITQKNSLKTFKKAFAQVKKLEALLYFYASLNSALLLQSMQYAPRLFLNLTYQNEVVEDKIVKVIQSYSKFLEKRGEIIANLAYDHNNPFQTAFFNKLNFAFKEDLQACLLLLKDNFNEELYLSLKKAKSFSEQEKNYLKKLRKNKQLISLLDQRLLEIEGLIPSLPDPESESLSKKRFDHFQKNHTGSPEEAKSALLKEFRQLERRLKIKVLSNFEKDPLKGIQIIFGYLNENELDNPFYFFGNLLQPFSKNPQLLSFIFKEEPVALAFIRKPNKLKSFAQRLNTALNLPKAVTTNNDFFLDLDFSYIKTLWSILPEEACSKLTTSKPELFLEEVRNLFSPYFDEEVPIFCFKGLLEEKFASQIFYYHPKEMIHLMKQLTYSTDKKGFEKFYNHFETLLQKASQVNPQLFFFNPEEIQNYPAEELNSELIKTGSKF